MRLKQILNILLIAVIMFPFITLNNTSKAAGGPYFSINGEIIDATVIQPGKTVEVKMQRIVGNGDIYGINSVSSSDETIATVVQPFLDAFNISAKKTGDATITIKYQRQGGKDEQQSQIHVEVANDLSEVTVSDAAYSKEIKDLLRLRDAYESIDFAGYHSILTLKGYANMSESRLKDLGNELRGLGGIKTDDTKSAEYLKQKGAVGITEEYLQKFDEMVRDPIKPPDSATEAEFQAYRDLEDIKDAKKKIVITKRTIVRQLLQKVNDRVNSLNYKANEEFNIDKTLWDTALEFLSTPEDTISGSKLTNAVIMMGNWLTSIAAIVFPLLTAVMGIRYLTTDSQGKGKLKTQMVGLLISTGVAFGAFIIWKIMYQIMTVLIK